MPSGSLRISDRSDLRTDFAEQRARRSCPTESMLRPVRDAKEHLASAAGACASSLSWILLDSGMSLRRVRAACQTESAGRTAGQGARPSCTPKSDLPSGPGCPQPSCRCASGTAHNVGHGARKCCGTGRELKLDLGHVAVMRFDGKQVRVASM